MQEKHRKRPLDVQEQRIPRRKLIPSSNLDDSEQFNYIFFVLNFKLYQNITKLLILELPVTMTTFQ